MGKKEEQGKLAEQIKDVGTKLLDSTPSSKDALTKLLKQAATFLSEIEQTPPKSVLESMQPFLNAIVKPDILKHQDREVKLFVATCVCEITRITAPEAPYGDDVLKDIFQLIVSTFSGLNDTSGPSFSRRVMILETLAKYRSCVVMLDLECDDLVKEMFSTFFTVARDEHAENVLSAMRTIMVVLLEESEDVTEDLLLVLLSNLGRKRKDITSAARKLATSVIEHCAGKLEHGIKQFIIESMSGDRKSLECQIDYHEVIYDIYRTAPGILLGIVPYLTGELLSDQPDVRLKAVGLAGDLFALPGSAIPEGYQPIFLEFLKRLTDRVVEVRMSVLEHTKTCLVSNPFRAEAPQIMCALSDRLLDYDENVRKQVVAVVCDVGCDALRSIPVGTIKLVSERLRDKSLLVKKYTMERLADIFRTYCSNRSSGVMKSDEYDWIPGKILRCFYDKDFRSDTIETILCLSLFPSEFSVKEKVKCWVRVFAGFDRNEVKALEKILEQKQRFQQEMQKYLSLRLMYQDSDATEVHKKVAFCFRIMSRCFTDPVRTEENFRILDQLKDANIWKILTTLLDPNTSCLQAYSCRDDLLRILGEKHRLYEFLGVLSLKCSYLLFNKEHVKDLILEIEIQKSTESTELLLSSMSILVALARFSPVLLTGIEEELIHLLEDDNEIIKEGVLHILAKAGGAIREQLGVSSRSLDLMLERICIEGSRRQAKYAVHALASITKDDGLMSLSVLYKRLVDMLEEKSHLPAVLQSLGCIAQAAMPVFETRESEIKEFIKKNLLESGQKSEAKEEEDWDDRSELCSLKIFGIKTLVKSYMPVKDAHLRSGIDELLGIIKNIICFGEISKEMDSSSLDKAHLRLAAAKAILRLSRHWDQKIPLDLFYMTLTLSDVTFPQVKKLLLDKVYQYIKDRVLDPKYACAFLLDNGISEQDSEELKRNLNDIILTCQQGKARQLSTQCDTNSSALYPEYILPFLVHALAHHPSFPNIDECKDVKAYEPIYRQLYVFLSMLVHSVEEGKSEVNIIKEKETISVLHSTFMSIKQSEDASDATKSKNLYAVCELGLSIINRLVPEQDGLGGSSMSVSLPPLLYRPHEKKEGVDLKLEEGRTWLADESILAHFGTLKFEGNGKVNSAIVEDEVMKDSESDGNDVPLGKIIQRLKAKGVKARKEIKESTPAAVKNESSVDILEMVREINTDNMDATCNFETSNGHEDLGRKNKSNQKTQKRKASVNDSKDRVPKRRRKLSSANKSSLPKITLKGSDDEEGRQSSESTEMDDEMHNESKDKSLQEKIDESEESDFLVSSARKNVSSSLKRKGKHVEKGHDEMPDVDSAEDLDVKTPKKLKAPESEQTSRYSKSGSVKKQKRKSISGLAKCTSQDDGSPVMDLIGCRIKVWWPMDKKFYEGVVKSFDTEKKKHVILYDDGDVEVLRLEKERWELVNKGRKPVKRSNSSKGFRSKTASSEKKKQSSVGSRRNDKLADMSSSPQIRGRRTPRKNLKSGKKVVSKSKAGSWGSQDLVSSPRFNVDDLDSEEEQLDRIQNSSTDEDRSDKGEKSVHEEKLEDAASGSSDAQEFKEPEHSEDRQIEDAPSSPDNAHGSDGDEFSSPERKSQLDATVEQSREEADGAEKLDSQDSHSADEVDICPAEQDASVRVPPPDSPDSELSDEEPLSIWKHRIGKSIKGK